MMDSAIAVGGWSALINAALIGWLAAGFMPAKWGRGFKLRWWVLWMLWCGLTPVMPWHIDLPLMIAYMLVMENVVWHYLTRKQRAVPS